MLDIAGFLEGIRTSAASWESAIQLIAAFAALVVAIVATRIAGQAKKAEADQAEIANKALAAANNSELARRRESEFLAMRPILPYDFTLEVKSSSWYVMFKYRITGEYPVLNVAFILRGRSESGEVDAVTYTIGSKVPNTGEVPSGIPADKFMSAGPNAKAFGSAWEFVVQYTGLLGQWVNEHYELQPNTYLGGSQRWWRLYRLEMQPSEGLGSGNLELPFGEPFGDNGIVSIANDTAPTPSVQS